MVTFVREGKWAAGAAFPFSTSLRGRRIGIVGMGRTGVAIANRLAAMNLEVAYSSRPAKPDLSYRYVANVLDLAKESDVLVLVVPGNSDTDNMIGAEELAALGPNGILINVARGTVVDEEALIVALKNGGIHAAGLDVFPVEPNVSQELIALPNVVLAPHIGSGTLPTR